MMKRKRRNVPNTRNVLAQRLECLECPLNPPNSEKKEILERSECSECRKETTLKNPKKPQQAIIFLL